MAARRRSHGISVPPDGPINCVSTTPTIWQWCSWRSTAPPTGKCDDRPPEWMPPDKRNSVQVRRPLLCRIAEQVRGGEGQPESWQHDGLRGRAKRAGGVGEGAGSGLLGDDCSYPMIVSGCGDRLFGTHRQPNYTDTRSHVGAVFKSACPSVSESDECRAAPKMSGRASLGCRPGVSATARACPVDWARGGHGDEGLRTADLARVSQLDCDARSSARRAGVLGPGSVIGGARTSNL